MPGDGIPGNTGGTFKFSITDLKKKLGHRDQKAESGTSGYGYLYLIFVLKVFNFSGQLLRKGLDLGLSLVFMSFRTAGF